MAALSVPLRQRRVECDREGRVAAEFYKNEVDDVRKTLNNQGGRNKGDTYFRTEEQRKQLRISFPNRYWRTTGFWSGVTKCLIAPMRLDL